MTRDTLAALLKAKDNAKRDMSAAYAACGASSGASIEARLALDLDRIRCLNAYCAADKAYDEAIQAYVVGAK